MKNILLAALILFTLPSFGQSTQTTAPVYLTDENGTTINPALDRTTAAAPLAVRLSNGISFYNATGGGGGGGDGSILDGVDSGIRATVTAGLALKVDGSAVTQPMSAITLPLPTGASTSALQTTGNGYLGIMADWDESDRAKVNLIVGQAGIQAGAGNVSANTPRVVLASDQEPVDTKRTIDTQFVSVTGTQNVDLNCSTGINTAVVHILGTWSGNIAFEGSLDGVNFFPVSATDVIALDGQIPVNTGTNGAWRFDTTGLATLRMSAIVTGTADIKMSGSSGTSVITAVQAITFTDTFHSALPDGASTEAKQDSQITQATSTNTKLDTVIGHVDGVEGKLDTGNTSLDSIDDKTPILARSSIGSGTVTAPGLASGLALTIPDGTNEVTVIVTGTFTNDIIIKVSFDGGSTYYTPDCYNASAFPTWRNSVSGANAPANFTCNVSRANKIKIYGEDELGFEFSGTANVIAYGSSRAKSLLSIAGFVDVNDSFTEAYLPLLATEATLESVRSSLDTLDNDPATGTLVTATNTRIGATNETAAATDTSTSGLNGLTKRGLQRMTNLIALFPSSLGQTTMAASFPVTLASNQSALSVSDASTHSTLTSILTSTQLIDDTVASSGTGVGGMKPQLIGGADNSSNLKEIRTDVNGNLQVVDGSGNAVARETGNLATIQTNTAAGTTALQIMDDWDESDRAKVNPIVGQAGVKGGAGISTADTQRIAIATDANAVAATLAAETTKVIGTVNLSAETTKVIGSVNIIGGQTSITAGAGSVAANTPRVTLAADDPAVASVQILDNVVQTIGSPTPTQASLIGGNDGSNIRGVAVDTSGVVLNKGGLDNSIALSFNESVAAPTAAVWYLKRQWQPPASTFFRPSRTQSVVTTAGSRTFIGVGRSLGTLNTGTNAFAATGSVASPNHYSKLIGCVTTVLSAASDNITITYTDDLGNTGHATGAITFAASSPVGNCYEFTLATTTGQMTDNGVRAVTNITDSAATTGVITVYGINTMHDAFGVANTFETSSFDNSVVTSAESIFVMLQQAATTAQQRGVTVVGSISTR